VTIKGTLESLVTLNGPEHVENNITSGEPSKSQLLEGADAIDSGQTTVIKFKVKRKKSIVVDIWTEFLPQDVNRHSNEIISSKRAARDGLKKVGQSIPGSSGSDK